MIVGLEIDNENITFIDKNIQKKNRTIQNNL